MMNSQNIDEFVEKYKRLARRISDKDIDSAMFEAHKLARAREDELKRLDMNPATERLAQWLFEPKLRAFFDNEITIEEAREEAKRLTRIRRTGQDKLREVFK